MDNRQSFLLVTIVITLAIAALMVKPYLGYIVTGLLLAFLLYPLQRRAEKRFGSRVTALLLIILTVLVAVLPFVIVGGAVAEDAARLVENLRQGGLPSLDTVEAQFEQLTGIQADFREQVISGLQSVASTLTGSLSNALTALSSVALGLTLMLFAEFYGLKEGDRFVSWTKGFESIPTQTQDRLYSRTSEVTAAVLKGHLGVALVQGVLIGASFFLVGIPSALFWSFVMIILGLIPIIGSALVWIPAAIYLFIQGSTVAGAALFLWGALVASLSDDFLRPYLVNGSADIHPFLVIVGVIGGIYVFGAVGIFLGPIVLGVARASLDLYREER